MPRIKQITIRYQGDNLIVGFATISDTERVYISPSYSSKKRLIGIIIRYFTRDINEREFSVYKIKPLGEIRS